MADHSTEEYLECCLYFTANTMSRLINKMTEEVFMPTGLAPSYAFLMMVVIDKPGISQGDLANILKLAPSTVTRFIDKLIIQGYVIRKSEGKGTRILPTDKGNASKEAIHDAWKRLFDKYCEVLGKEFAVKLTADMATANKLLER